jgi:hypothetical protein
MAHDTAGTLMLVGKQYRSSKTYGRMTLLSQKGEVQQDYFFSHGDSDHDELRDVAMLPNGLGALAVGRTGNEVWLAAIDLATGIVLWDRSIAIGAKAGANAIAILEDGGFAITGTTEDTAGKDVLVARFKPEGTMVWARACGGSGTDAGYDISIGPGGGFVVGGETDSKYGIVDGWMFGLDDQGYMLWEFLHEQRSVRKITRKKTGGLLFLDEDWILFDTKLELIQNPFFSPNWRGPKAWTANASFANSSKSTLSGIRNPSLTCREIGTMNFTDRRIPR